MKLGGWGGWEGREMEGGKIMIQIYCRENIK